ncbi:MAG: UvrD-helicase domain-containing protein [Balneolaceae bacterium]
MTHPAPIDNAPTGGGPSFLNELNEQQRRAVTTTDGPLLIVAGAGSGKTRVLTYRIAYLLQQQKALPEQILALTFTNKAAREMKERISHLIDERAKRLWMGTFHSIFARILRYEADKIGFNKDFSIYDTSDSEQSIKLILGELNYDPKEIRPRTIHQKISDAKNQLIGPDQYNEKFVLSTLDEITSRVYKIYQARLRQANAMDFDDLLVRPIELFETNPDVLERYQHGFRYILIDEYQDTNHAQYKATRMLAAAHNNLCVVGDDAQSIYSFRGADIGNILNFKNDYDSAAQVPLEQNYRSTGAILQCADSIIKRNRDQLEKTLWTENQQGSMITLLENYDDRDEANRVVNYIDKLRMQKGYSLNDIAILYRTNYQSRLFEEALRRHGIAYQLVGGLSFYQRKEIKDVLSYLKLLVNPHDEQSLLRIINEPSRGIGKKSLNTLLHMAREQGRSVWSILEQSNHNDLYKPARARISDFVSMIHSLRDELEKGGSILEVTRSLLEKSGYMQALVEENSIQSLSRRDHILELQNAISYFEKGGNASLSSFLQEISLVTDSDKYDEEKPAVTLMTIHGSKGLEFPGVFIVGLEENLFPMGGRDGEEANIEEERRLFYVAITRAQEELFFSHCKLRFKFGEEVRQLRSRFLNEVDPGVVRTETGATIQQNRDQSGSASRSGGTSTGNTGRSGYQIDYDTLDRNRDQNPTTRRAPAAATHSEIEIEYDPGEGDDPFYPGVDVIHPAFGQGSILSREGSGRDSRVVVFFPKRGRKTLMLRVARLKPVHS